ncbi:MAG: bleomycin resistance family protein [Cyanobacteriota bacterium]|nr:bleomycin resistance family protein [Cyanobacteriota bacterium]
MTATSNPNRSQCKFENSIPILNVKNIADSLNYYTKVLGFQIDWEWEDPPTFASVSRDSVCLFFCQEGQGHSGTWISIFVDNVDELYREYQAKGAVIRQEPIDYPWGTREINIEDPDGHRLRICMETCIEAQ